MIVKSYRSIWLSIKNITGPDPANFTESTEDSGPGLRSLSENDDLSVPEFSSGTGSNEKTASLLVSFLERATQIHIIKFLWGLKIIIYWNK